ncbi:MAG: HEAT repeat domain-containing protein [Bacteroidota bacterium]
MPVLSFRTIRLVLFAVLLGSTAEVQAQPIHQHPTPTDPLQERWAWAQEHAERDDHRAGYWVGYQIQRKMRARSWIGSWNRDGQNRPTLAEQLGRSTDPGLEPQRRSLAEVAREALSEYDEEQAQPEDALVERDVALLFLYDQRGRLDEVKVSNLDLRVDLEKRPLWWLGQAERSASLALVDGLFQNAPAGQREDLTSTVALHGGDAPGVGPWLTRVIEDRGEDLDVREQAVFWLGETNAEGALPFLEALALSDEPQNLREEAVFAIHLPKTPASTEALIRLTKSSQDPDVREQAIFWLGQTASEQAAAALRDVVDDGGDVELQKQAVFALSELPNNEGIPPLMDVARTHPRLEVRKQAIFWLGQSDDPRALDLLIELARNR